MWLVSRLFLEFRCTFLSASNQTKSRDSQKPWPHNCPLFWAHQIKPNRPNPILIAMIFPGVCRRSLDTDCIDFFRCVPEITWSSTFRTVWWKSLAAFTGMATIKWILPTWMAYRIWPNAQCLPELHSGIDSRQIPRALTSGILTQVRERNTHIYGHFQCQQSWAITFLKFDSWVSLNG